MRSTFTNKLLREFLDGSHYLVVDDGGALHTCHTFREATEVVDSVDDCAVYVHYKYTAKCLGVFTLTMCNDDEEQLIDHSDNTFITPRIDRLLKGVA